MRRDIHLLEDMRLAASDIADYVAGMKLADFRADRKTQAAVERELITLGEAANRITSDFKAQHPQVPWKRLAHIRNFYVHGYERLNPEEVWGTASRFIPRVLRLVTPLVPPDDEGA